MKVLLVSDAGVRSLLPADACLPLMREALTALSRGDSRAAAKRGQTFPTTPACSGSCQATSASGGASA